MIAGILAVITIVILIIQVQYYRNKAREFESLFELSKGYGSFITIAPNNPVLPYTGSASVKPNSKKPGKQLNPKVKKQILNDIDRAEAKLNKDGSIAKKRGRKPKNA